MTIIGSGQNLYGANKLCAGTGLIYPAEINYAPPG